MMGEHEETGGARQQPTTDSAGLVRGIPSRRIASTGMLDLRGVPAEEVAKIEYVESAGIVLLDSTNSAAFATVRVSSAGSVLVAPPELRVIVGDREITRAMVEGMASGQKLLVVGNVFFRPEVPAGMAAEKFEDLRIVGTLVACEELLGALFGKMEITGTTVALPDGVAKVALAIGQMDLTADYLSRLEDGTTYVNIGKTTVAHDLEEELLDRKLVSYHNVGQTSGPQGLLSLLQARGGTNRGQFHAVSLAEGGSHVENYSSRKLTRAFLERLPDGSHYENYGETLIGADVPADLLAVKIGSYTNYGVTTGPADLLGALEARCVENYGTFVEGAEFAGEGKEQTL